MNRALVVGQNQQYAEPHQLPKLQQGDRITIHGRATAYQSRLPLTVSDVRIDTAPGPNGERVTFDARGAKEPTWATYFSPDVARNGCIYIGPDSSRVNPTGITVNGVKVIGCRKGRAFTNSAGQPVVYNYGGGIMLYRCREVTIQACAFDDHDTGVFGKSFAEAANVLRNVTVEWCNFNNCGMPGSDRYHPVYLEGLNTVYQYNHFQKPISGSSGCNIKDRGAGTIIRYNRIEGGARTIDLVDPEEAGAVFMEDPGWGRIHIYGNLILNPAAGGSGSMIHLGFDGQYQYAQWRLFFQYNTVVSYRQKGTHYKTFLFKTNGAQEIYSGDNIFDARSSDGNPSDTYLLTDEGSGDPQFFTRGDWFSKRIMTGEIRPDGWDSRIVGDDPAFVEPWSGDVRLKKTSGAVAKAVVPAVLPWAIQEPVMEYSPAEWTWNKRADVLDCGAIDFAAVEPPPPPPPPPSVVRFEEVQNNTAECLKGTGSWPWGVSVLPGIGLLFTEHVNGSWVLEDKGGGQYALGQKVAEYEFRPLVFPNGFDGSGRPGLFGRHIKGPTTFRHDGSKFVPVTGFAYQSGEQPLWLCQIGDTTLTHDYGKYSWTGNGWVKAAYTNPIEARLPADVAKMLTAAKTQRFFRSWYVDGMGYTVLCGFTSYGGPTFGRYLVDQGGTLVDMTAAMGLPLSGTPCYVGGSAWVIVGSGLYLKDGDRFKLVPGSTPTTPGHPLTDFVRTPGVYCHQCTPMDADGDGAADHLMIFNPRGRVTRIFRIADWEQVLSISSWDGEGACVADYDGDGCDDLLVGSGGGVRIFVAK